MPAAKSVIEACKCKAAWGSPGKTIRTSSIAAPRPAKSHSATPPSTASASPNWSSTNKRHVVKWNWVKPMSRILSDRAEKTDQVVLLPASLEDPSKSPPGVYRVALAAICVSVFTLFTALVMVYYWRARAAPFWTPIPLPKTLWMSTALIAASSLTFEAARRVFRRGLWRLASHLLLATASLGAGFLASQLSAWRELVRHGAYLKQNPHSTFFYLFTGLHGVHLIGGLVALFVVVLGKSKRRELVDVVALYWHFLGLIWIALFTVLLSR